MINRANMNAMPSRVGHRLSWTLNAILAAAAVALVLAPNHAARPAVVSAAPPSAAAAPARDLPARSDSPVYSANWSPQVQRRWLIDELRAMGVPNAMLADVVLADLDADWTKRSAALALKTHGNPDAMAAFQLNVDRTRDAEMRAALGEAGFLEWDHANMLREIDRGNVRLSASETATSYQLWKNLQRRQLELRESRLKGELDESEITAALGKAVADYSTQMKALLGDERYARAQRPADAPAEETLRQDLAKANPSDAQFQQLLQTQEQWNQQRADLDRKFADDPTSSAYAAQRRALDETRDETYRHVLGDAAFETLQKEQNPSYATMKQHAELWGLSDATIDSVYGGLAYYQKTIADYQAQARAMEAQGQAIDWAAVHQNLRQFATQTQESLRTYLGAARYDQLRRNGVFTSLMEPPQYARPNGDIDPTHTVSVH